MVKLEAMQRWAERCAEKLGVTDTITLRWGGGECKVKPYHNAHCHVYGDTLPRGTICFNHHVTSWSIRDWHRLVAHEVAHLAVKSDHNSVTFARRMVALGQANYRQQVMIKAQRRHRHQWSQHYSVGRPLRRCTICGKEQVGTITWKDRKRGDDD